MVLPDWRLVGAIAEGLAVPVLAHEIRPPAAMVLNARRVPGYDGHVRREGVAVVDRIPHVEVGRARGALLGREDPAIGDDDRSFGVDGDLRVVPVAAPARELHRTLRARAGRVVRNAPCSPRTAAGRSR